VLDWGWSGSSSWSIVDWTCSGIGAFIGNWDGTAASVGNWSSCTDAQTRDWNGNDVSLRALCSADGSIAWNSADASQPMGKQHHSSWNWSSTGGSVVSNWSGIAVSAGWCGRHHMRQHWRVAVGPWGPRPGCVGQLQARISASLPIGRSRWPMVGWGSGARSGTHWAAMTGKEATTQLLPELQHRLPTIVWAWTARIGRHTAAAELLPIA
jgi:hypothetical protein